MTEEIHSERNRFADQFRQRAIESAAVIISAISLLVSVICIVVATVSLFIALSTEDDARFTREEMEVYEIYINKLHADLVARGFTPPSVPGERE